MEMFFPSVIIINEKNRKKHYVQTLAEIFCFNSTQFPALALIDVIQCNFRPFS